MIFPTRSNKLCAIPSGDRLVTEPIPSEVQSYMRVDEYHPVFVLEAWSAVHPQPFQRGQTVFGGDTRLSMAGTQQEGLRSAGSCPIHNYSHAICKAVAVIDQMTTRIRASLMQMMEVNRVVDQGSLTNRNGVATATQLGRGPRPVSTFSMYHNRERVLDMYGIAMRDLRMCIERARAALVDIQLC